MWLLLQIDRTQAVVAVNDSAIAEAAAVFVAAVFVTLTLFSVFFKVYCEYMYMYLGGGRGRFVRYSYILFLNRCTPIVQC